MKMYIVHTDTKKLFYDEQSLIKYLGTEKSKRIYYGGKYISKLDWVKIETVEVEILEESVASSYLESYIESTNRQTKVNSILGDDLSQKLEKFKSMFEEFAKDDVLRKRFLNQLETTPVENIHDIADAITVEAKIPQEIITKHKIKMLSNDEYRRRIEDRINTLITKIEQGEIKLTDLSPEDQQVIIGLMNSNE